MRLMLKLWKDDCGALIATEWVFVATILIIGIVAGLGSVRLTLTQELHDMAAAIASLSQTFSFGGSSGCCSFNAGSFFTDFPEGDSGFIPCFPAVSDNGLCVPTQP